jgi:hypothetical protein
MLIPDCPIVLENRAKRDRYLITILLSLNYTRIIFLPSLFFIPITVGRVCR